MKAKLRGAVAEKESLSTVVGGIVDLESAENSADRGCKVWDHTSHANIVSLRGNSV